MIIWAGISRCRQYSRVRNHERATHRASESTYANRSSRNSLAADMDANKRLSTIPSAPTYEGHELQTIREASGQSRQSQNSNANWAGLQPFDQNQAPNEYAPLPPVATNRNNDWTGLQWMDNK